MQMIFEQLSGGCGGDETLAMVYEQFREQGTALEGDPSLTDRAYITRLLEGVLNELDTLDDLISGASRGWTIERMPKVDLTILRLGVWEILHRTADTPGPVVVNEAVELANQYSGENSGRFINGVLGTILRAQEDQPQ